MYKSTYPMIGILGGMGPFTSGDLFRKIIANTIANKDQEHIPTLMASIPHEIEDRTSFLKKISEVNPGYNMAQLALWLENAGVTHCAVPCNTAHSSPIWAVMQEDLKKANSKLVFVHILEELKKEIDKRVLANAKNGRKPRLGLLATDGTHVSGLYKNYFDEATYDIVAPSAEGQKKVMDAIFSTEYGLKAFSNNVQDMAVSQLKGAMQDLKLQDVDLFILGCTELSFGLLEPSYFDIPCVDPVNIQARALIRATYPEKLKED